MNYLIAFVVLLSVVPVAAARSTAELVLSPDGSRAVAQMSNCREYAYDYPQQCESESTHELPDLVVDQASRTISRDGEVVARWSRLGRFVRLERSYRLRIESSAARVTLERVNAK